MTSVHDLLARCLALAQPMPTLDVVLHDAVGCILAIDVLARDDLPHVDVAAYDGYAGAARDLRPHARLRVLDDVRSGEAEPTHVVPDTCVRIASGAVLPAGADAVVPAEHTDGGLAEVVIRRAADPGDGVRRRAEDLRAGAVVLAAGERIGPRQIGLLAAAGLGRAPVHPRPRVVVLPVGSDLTEAGRWARPGTVFDANGHALASAVQDADGTVFRVAAVPDDRARLRETIEDQVVRADLVVLTGGLSAGREDPVTDVLTHLGTVRIEDVAVSPAHRLGIGTVGDGDGVPLLALPGHPVAAQVAFEVFVRPMLRSMSGEADLFRPSLAAASLAPWESPAGRAELVPVTLSGSPDEGYRFRPVGRPGRPTLSDLARANALAVVGEETTHVALGDVIRCMVLDG